MSSTNATQGQNAAPVQEWTAAIRYMLFILTACMVAMLLIFRGHLVMDGHTWNTADWLINADVVHVRRGLFGSALLRISDALGVSPVSVVIALQCTLASIIFLCALHAIRKAPSRELVALLLFSPGFCLLFWAGEQVGTARKEMIAYAAMSLLLLSNGRAARDNVVFVGASALFALGISGHIANAMMTPMFLFMARLSLGRTSLLWIAGSGLLLVWAAFNTWYPIRFSSISSAMDVCRPLLERGLDEALCADAIRVTAGNTRGAIEYVASEAYGNASGAWHLLIYPALILPIVYLVRRTDGWDLFKWPMLLSLLPLLPLYSVGYDWGRQTVMHITPLILLAVLAVKNGHMVQTKPVTRWVVGLLVLSGTLWVPKHTFGIEYGVIPTIFF